MSARNKNAQIRLATSEASVVIEEPKGRQKTIPPLSTWKRRLNTSQDQFRIHTSLLDLVGGFLLP
jgi:hypothetical protein